MIKVAIIGAAGFSGLELISLLEQHSGAELTHITSDKHAGQALSAVFPKFASSKLVFSTHDADCSSADVAFLAIPNKASLSKAVELCQSGLRVIDLSGAFRLKDQSLYPIHYGFEHSATDWLQKAVYGLPELFANDIRQAQLIANPGCYAICSLLGLLPLKELVEQLHQPPIIDAKSGVSGAGGRTEDDSMRYMRINENFRAYKLFCHQHQPEIAAWFAASSHSPPSSMTEVTFTPHLLPLERGILGTIYLNFKTPQPDLYQRYQDYYAQNQQVIVLPEGADNELGHVQRTNLCALSLHSSSDGLRWTVVSAIDNLLRGASGNALDCLNIAFGIKAN